jgi:integrase
MRAAYEDDRIPRLPCPRNPPIGRGKRKAVRFLTEGEVEALAGAIVPAFEIVIYVAAYGGFRIGELFALRLDDVDWLRGTIRVDENLTDVNGRLEFGTPKTERASRTVPIAEPVLEKLARHVENTECGIRSTFSSEAGTEASCDPTAGDAGISIRRSSSPVSRR